MLAASQRLRTAAEFQAVMKGGARSATSTVVVYVKQTGDASSMAGFAVSRAVGGAVTRNTVKRRLRVIARELLADWGNGFAVVVRALPASAHAPFAQLRQDVVSAAEHARRKAAP